MSIGVKKLQTMSETSSNGKNVVHFASEVKQEFKKIDWTTKEELISYTKVVVIGTFLFGFLIYFMDLMIQGALFGFGWFFKLIVGGF